MRMVAVVLVAAIALGACSAQGQTRTVTKEVTPESCRAAIADSRTIAGISSRFGTTVIHLVDAYGDELHAAILGNLVKVMESLPRNKRFNRDVRALTAELGPAVDSFKAHAKACESR